MGELDGRGLVQRVVDRPDELEIEVRDNGGGHAGRALS